ncbi:class I SAM-dependent methyltransferase [Streptomyces sp. NPDC051636]|uniref:class I SAM-dependent methyltransferase n=1 Tax=Streptomyces sp. NPDC051636 TaxID=3365663 RepID=UPI0037AB383D
MHAAAKPTMRDLQEQAHNVGHDYANGSPHIRHHSVRQRVVDEVQRVLGSVQDRKGRCRILELGAGHGTFTDHLVAAGAEVEVTEMSAPSAELLRHRFRHNPLVTVTHDPEGKAAFSGPSLDAVVAISVLHHIPDYLGTVERLIQRIVPGGAFLSFQDPLWYPRRSKVSMSLDRNAYLLWRIGQGGYRSGMATRIRRMRGVYDESKAADMVEYHVVRQGVDEKALHAVLTENFHRTHMHRYWSTQSGLLQALGERMAPPTTFGLVAELRR